MAVDFKAQCEYSSDFLVKNVALEWAFLTQPDTTHDAEGVYRVNLLMSEEDAAPLAAHYEEIRTAWVDYARMDLKKPKLKESGNPIRPSEEHPGMVEIRLKVKAHKADGTRRRVKVVDSQLNPVPNEIRIGNGTTANVKISLWPWYNPAQGAGVTLKPNGVQIIDLKEFQGGGGEDFEAVDDGFTAETNEFEAASGPGDY